MNIHDEQPTDELFTERDREATEDQMLSLCFRRQAQESAKLIAAAKEMVWRDVPVQLRRHYLEMARQEQ